MVRHLLPGGLEPLKVAGLSEAVQQRLHQPGVRGLGVLLPCFQPVAQGHQFIDLGDDAMLFLKWRHRYRSRESFANLDERLRPSSTKPEHLVVEP